MGKRFDPSELVAMSVLTFVLWTIARCALVTYVCREVAYYLSILIQRSVNGVFLHREESFAEVVLFGVLSGVIFFVGAIVGGLRGNFLGLLLLLLLMVSGSVLGGVCQWVTPLRSFIKGCDR